MFVSLESNTGSFWVSIDNSCSCSDFMSNGKFQSTFYPMNSLLPKPNIFSSVHRESTCLTVASFLSSRQIWSFPFYVFGFFLKLLFKVKKRQSLLASRELEIKNDKMVFYKEFSWGIFCQCIHLSLSLAQLLWSFTSEMVQAQRVLICKLGWLLVLKNMDACKDTVNNEGTR